MTPSKNAPKSNTHSWNKPWPESTKTYSRTRNSSKESLDHPEQPKQYRLWKQRSQCSPKTSKNQNTGLQSTPPVTSAGNEPQVSTHFKSQIYLNTRSVINTAKTKSWGGKVAQILYQNTDLSDKIAEEYQTASEKLKKDPIMALVTKTVSTYMLIRHSKNTKDKPKAEDFSS